MKQADQLQPSESFDCNFRISYVKKMKMKMKIKLKSLHKGGMCKYANTYINDNCIVSVQHADKPMGGVKEKEINIKLLIQRWCCGTEVMDAFMTDVI